MDNNDIRADIRPNKNAPKCARCIHPGEILLNEMEFRGISQKDLAEQIGLSPLSLEEILSGRRAINTRYAMLLEAALGIDSNVWVNLQNEYNKDKAQSSPSFMKRIKRIREVAAFL